MIVSDASIPGEGEHKLMEFIRNQRMQPGYDPNTSHCIFGLDADLIMLSMVTHELRFSVLREMVTQTYNTCKRCNKAGHMLRDCTAGLEYVPRVDGNGYSSTVVQQFQFLDIPTLKEYLEFDMKPLNADRMSFAWDIERACDDFVLICFLVGNDFLPHLPAMEIREGAIDVMMACYRDMLPTLGGYLAKDGNIEFSRLGKLMKRFAELEDDILLRRADDAARYLANQEKLNQEKNNSSNNNNNNNGGKSDSTGGLNLDIPGVAVTSADVEAEIKRLKEAKLRTVGAAELVEEQEKVNYGHAGWEDRYFRIKFGRPEGSQDKEFVREVAHSFVDGMVWVLQYYFQGCIDWAWFYPYHYPPTSACLANSVDWDTFVPRIAKRGSTQPFTPLQQLMAVLPSGSAWCLPKAYADLMTNPTSPLLKYYPLEFAQDAEGLVPQQLYKAVALLPFIDAEELIATLTALEDQLTPAERARNQFGKDRLFVRLGSDTKVEEEMLLCVEGQTAPRECAAPGRRTNLFGYFSFCPDWKKFSKSYPVPFQSNHLRTLEPNCGLCCFFDCGPMPPGGYEARVLPGAIRAANQLGLNDYRELRSSKGTHAVSAFFDHRNAGSRTRAFDPDMPTQGINPFSAPGNHHSRSSGMSWQQDQRREDWNRSGGGSGGGGDNERVSYDVVIKGFPPEESESRLLDALKAQCARENVRIPGDGFRLHRIQSGLMFLRGQTLEDQERNLRLVNGINGLTGERPKSSGRSRDNSNRDNSYPRRNNNNNNRGYDQQQQYHQPQQQQQQQQQQQHPYQQQQQQHYAQYSQYGQPQYHQQHQQMQFPPQYGVAPAAPQYFAGAPAPVAAFPYPYQTVSGGAGGGSWNPQNPPAYPQQGFKRVEPPAALVGREDLKRARPDNGPQFGQQQQHYIPQQQQMPLPQQQPNPVQLVAQLTQLQKLAALQAKLDALKKK